MTVRSRALPLFDVFPSRLRRQPSVVFANNTLHFFSFQASPFYPTRVRYAICSPAPSEVDSCTVACTPVLVEFASHLCGGKLVRWTLTVASEAPPTPTIRVPFLNEKPSCKEGCLYARNRKSMRRRCRVVMPLPPPPSLSEIHTRFGLEPADKSPFVIQYRAHLARDTFAVTRSALHHAVCLWGMRRPHAHDSLPRLARTAACSVEKKP